MREEIAFCMYRHTLAREYGTEKPDPKTKEMVRRDYRKDWDTDVSENAKEYWRKCADQYLGEYNGTAECNAVSICG